MSTAVAVMDALPSIAAATETDATATTGARAGVACAAAVLA